MEHFDFQKPTTGNYSKFLQQFPPLKQKTLFPSFDYVDKPYADILDAIAASLIAWTAASIFLGLIYSLYGSNTKTLVVKDVVERLTHVSTAPIWTFKNSTFTRPKVRLCRNFWLRMFSLLIFLLLIFLEVLVIFSQLSKTTSRSLDELNLKHFSLDIPSNDGIQFLPTIGCSHMVSHLRFNSEIPLYFCTSVRTVYLSSMEHKDKLRFHAIKSDHRFLRVRMSVPNEFMEIEHSVILRSKNPKVDYFANVSSLGLVLTLTKLAWISKNAKEECEEMLGSCDYQLDTLKSNIPMITTNYSKEYGYVHRTLILNYYAKMFKVSSTILRRTDFIVGKGDKSTEYKDIFRQVTSGKLKRTSGVILWILAAVLGTLKLVIERWSWDVDEKILSMTAETLDMPDSDSLKFSSNSKFQIVDATQSQSERMAMDCANGIETDSSQAILRLRQIDYPIKF